MVHLRLRARPALAGLMAALAVEFADELFDGTKSAAMPLIRHDLSLSYAQVGLLSAVPLIVGGMIELPVGVLAGAGHRRRQFVLAGGVVFIAAVLAAGLAPSFAVLLAALVTFFPASGAFVSLTQAVLLDSEPDRRPQLMARWTLAGSVGAMVGALLVGAVLAASENWRLAFIAVAAVAAAGWLGVLVTGPAGTGSGAPDEQSWPGLREAISVSARTGAWRWLMLLEVSNLLLDVFTVFLALYLVDVAHASPAVAALGVAVRLSAGLVGDALLVGALERLRPLRVLRVSVALAGMLLPVFLLVPGVGAKLVVLGALSVATAPLYPVLKAELFRSLPGRSGLAVSLASAASLVGGLGPLAVGVAAQHLGLNAAMSVLALAPVALLAALVPRGTPARTGRAGSGR